MTIREIQAKKVALMAEVIALIISETIQQEPSGFLEFDEPLNLDNSDGGSDAFEHIAVDPKENIFDMGDQMSGVDSDAPYADSTTLDIDDLINVLCAVRKTANPSINPRSV
ncbi:MAG: hypothetical protein EOO39_00570 [Cytophagaceae bacterium]|nr:MAG: hypothetical protein EOO39_00570 [Cytophagaceae bacterium]